MTFPEPAAVMDIAGRTPAAKAGSAGYPIAVAAEEEFSAGVGHRVFGNV
jgi:hypothetical protein